LKQSTWQLTGKAAQGGGVTGKGSRENGYASIARKVQTGLLLIQVLVTISLFLTNVSIAGTENIRGSQAQAGLTDP
jgi:hypothetical protein